MFVYKISNSINNKVYIGITSYSIEERYKWHVRDCKRGVDKKLYKAMRKYGVENFRIDLLEEVSDAIVVEEREEFYIEKYDSFNNGYNASPASHGIIRHTEKAKRLMSEKAKGRKQNREVIEKRSASMKKFWEENIDLRERYAEEARRKFKGKKHTDEFRDSARQRMLGATRKEETKQKISKANKGRTQHTHICIYCNKEGKSSAMFRWHFENCKDKK